MNQIESTFDKKITDVEYEDLPATKVDGLSGIDLRRKHGYVNLVDGRVVFLPQRALSQLLNKFNFTYRGLKESGEDGTSIIGLIDDGINKRRNDLIFRLKDERVEAVFTKEYVDIKIGWIQEQIDSGFNKLGVEATELEVRETEHAVWFNYKFKRTLDMSGVVEGEVFGMGLRICTSRVATASVRVFPYLERLVCMNGMTASESIGGKDRQIHRGKTAQDKRAVRRNIQHMIKTAIKTMETHLPRFINDTITRRVTRNQVGKVLKADYPMYFQKAVYFQLGRKFIDEDGATVWDVYNAITYVATHNRKCQKFTIKVAYQRQAYKTAEVLKTMADREPNDVKLNWVE